MPRKIWISYILLTLLFILGMWCSTGTMAMYAASHTWNRVLEPCRYLANVDHDHFLATFRFLNGEVRSSWESSVVLRRLLYPLLAYPLMSIWGFHIGGVISGMLLQLISVLAFLQFLTRRFDHRAALASAILLSTYPGIMYWVGLPYSYVMIVPCSLLCIILLWKLYETKQLREVLWISLALGTLFLGYDLLPYFGLAGLFLLLLKIVQQRPKKAFAILALPTALLALVLPTVLTLLYFQFVQNVSPQNANTGIYSTILMSYFSPGDLNAWYGLLRQAPSIFYHNFLYSNFLYLPLLFLCVVVLGRFFWKVRFHPVEITIMLSVLLVWCFGNLAPPYSAQWQIRGNWMARLYQPIFVVYLVYISRVAAHLTTLGKDRQAASKKTIYWLLVVLTAMANASIAFGPVLGLQTADNVYYNFYQHSVPNAVTLNMEKFGRRPLGFCAPENQELKKKKKKERRK